MPGLSQRPTATCGWWRTRQSIRSMVTLKTTSVKCWKPWVKSWSIGQENKALRSGASRTCTASFHFFQGEIPPSQAAGLLFMWHGGTDLNVGKKLKTVDTFNSSSLPLPTSMEVNLTKKVMGEYPIMPFFPTHPADILEDYFQFTNLSPFLPLFWGIVGAQHLNLLN